MQIFGGKARRISFAALAALLAASGLGFIPFLTQAAKANVGGAGELDVTMNGDGIASVNPGTGADNGHGGVLDSLGRTIIVGNQATTHGLVMTRSTDDGQLDRTFGSGGATNVAPSAFGSFTDIYPAEVKIFFNKIMVAGTAVNTSTSAQSAFFAVFTIDGVLDTTFSGDGLMTFHFAGNTVDWVQGFDYNPLTGKFLFAGTNGTFTAGFVSTFDPFGVGPPNAISAASAYKNVTDVSVDQDGNTYFGGQPTGVQANGVAYVTRVNLATGAVDPVIDGTIDLTGYPAFNAGWVSVISVVPDNNLNGQVALVGDSNSTSGFVVRLNHDGTVAPSGAQTYQAGTQESLNAALFDAAGNILVTGPTRTGASNLDVVIRRITPNGTLDPAYGNNGSGFRVMEWGGANDRPWAIQLMPDGRAVVMGTDGLNFAYARLTGDTPPAVTDGTKLVFSTEGSSFAINADGSEMVNLSNAPAVTSKYPDISISGIGVQQQVVGGRDQIVSVAGADGSNVTNISNNALTETEPSITTGNVVAFTSGTGAGACVMTMLANGSSRTVESCGEGSVSGASQGSITLEGGHIAYVANNGKLYVKTVNSAGSQFVVDTPPSGVVDTHPRWSKNVVSGDYNLLFTRSDGRIYRINNVFNSTTRNLDSNLGGPVAGQTGYDVVADQLDDSSRIAISVNGGTDPAARGVWVTGFGGGRIAAGQAFGVKWVRQANAFITSGGLSRQTSPAYVDAADVPLQSQAPGLQNPTHAAGILNLGLFKSPILNLGLFKSPILNLGLFKSGILNLGLFKSPILNLGLFKSGILNLGLFKSPLVQQGLNSITLSQMPLVNGKPWKQRLAESSNPDAQKLATKDLTDISIGDILRLDPPLEDTPSLADIDLLNSEKFGAIAVTPMMMASTRIKAIHGIDWCGAFEAMGAPDCGAAYGEQGSADRGLSATLLSLQLAGFKLDDMPPTGSGVNLHTNDLRRVTLGDVDMDPQANFLSNVEIDSFDLSRASVGSITLGQLGSKLNDVVDCSSGAQDCSVLTTNLAQVQGAHHIKDGATINDLGHAVDGFYLNELALATWGNAASDPFDVKPSGLGLIGRDANDGSTSVVTYQAVVSNAGNGSGPLVNPQIGITIPAGFTLKPGTVSWRNTQNGVGTTPLPDVAPDNTNTLKWDLTTTLSNPSATIEINFSLIPGTDTGPASANSLRVAVTTPFERYATGAVGGISMTDSLPNSLLQPNRLYIGHLVQTPIGLGQYNGTTVQYRIPRPPTGSRLNVYLSGLSYDADLVVYHPVSSDPSVPLRALSGNQPAISAYHDKNAQLGGGGEPVITVGEDDVPLDSNKPVAGVSATRGLNAEQVNIATWGGGSGEYIVQVSQPKVGPETRSFNLRYTVEGPAALTAQPRADLNNHSKNGATPTLTGTPETLILTAPSRFSQVYGASGASDIASALASLAGATNGRVFPVDSVQAVQDAYAALDANPSDPELSNDVVRAINAAVDAYLGSARSSLQNMIIVGTDEMIPMARVPDLTQDHNERTFAQELRTPTNQQNNALFGAAMNNTTLSDDPYGSFAPRSFNGTWMYVPDVALGRLVETPAQIVAAVTEFTRPLTNGDPAGTIRPKKTFVAGYDFMTNMSLAIQKSMRTQFPTAGNSSLIGEGWDKTALTNALTANGSAADIISINAHYSPQALAPPIPFDDNYPANADVDANEFTSNLDLQRRILFTMGCHAGFNIANYLSGGGSKDWAEALAGDSVAAYVANTGYGIGLGFDIPAFSERLFSDFADRIGQYSLGRALQQAKQDYASDGISNVYDYKILAQAVYYGIPNFKIAGAQPPPPPVSDVPGGVHTNSYGTKFASLGTSFTSGWQRHNTDDGSYWTVTGGSPEVTPNNPIVDELKRDVTVPNETARDVLVTGLHIKDEEPGFDGLIATTVVNNSNADPEDQFSNIFYPPTVAEVTSHKLADGTSRQDVTVKPNQFRSTGFTPDGKTIGVSRRYDQVTTEMTYSTSADVIRPTVLQNLLTDNGSGGVTLNVQATDANSSIVRIYVLYRKGDSLSFTGFDMNGSGGTRSQYLGQGAVGDFETIVQVVDAAGNVATSTGGTGLPTGAANQADPPAPTETQEDVLTATVSGAAPVNGWYSGARTVHITSSLGHTLFTKVNNGAETSSSGGSADVTLNTAGQQTVSYRSSSGESGSIIVPIDLADPTVSITSPTPNQSIPLHSTVNAAYSCGDDAALASCVGNIANGSPLDTSSVTPVGQFRTLTVTATDQYGNTKTESVNYKVVDATDTLTATVDGTPFGSTGIYDAATTLHIRSSQFNTITVTDSLGGTQTYQDGVADIVVHDGDHHFTFSTPNASGSKDVFVDEFTPQFSVVSPSVGAVYEKNQAVNASYSCTDTHLLACTGSVANGAALDTSTVGDHTFTIMATDKVNRGAGDTIHYTVVADDVNATVTGPNVGGVYTGNVTFSVTSSLGKDLFITVDGGAEQSFPHGTTAQVVVSGNGTHNVTYRSASGVTGGATFDIDTVGPVISITTPPSGTPEYLVGAVVTANYGCADSHPGSCVGTVANGSALDTSTLGAHTFTVNATDAVGNASTLSRDYTVVAPDIVSATLSGPSTNGIYTGAVTVSVTSSNGKDLWITVDNGAEQAFPHGTPAQVVVTADGHHTGTYRSASGAAGGFVFDIDTTSPSITITTPPSGTPEYSVGQVVNANYSCADAHPGTCVGTVANGTPINTSAAGTYNFVVNATDAAGNAAPTVSRMYTVIDVPDTVTVTVDGTTTNGYYTAATTMHVTSALGRSIAYKINGGAETTSPSPANIPLNTEGTLVVDYRTVNTTNPTTGSRTVKLDLFNPTVNITSPANGSVFTLGATAFGAYSCNDTGSGLALCSSGAGGTQLDTSSVTGTGQTKTFTVNAKDNVNKTASDSRTYKVQYADGTPCPGPTLSHRIGQSPQGLLPLLGAVVTITFRVCDANGVSVGPPRLAGVAAPTEIGGGVAQGSCAPLLNLIALCLPLLSPTDTAFVWQSGTYLWQFRQNTSGLSAGAHTFVVKLNDGTQMTYTLNIG